MATLYRVKPRFQQLVRPVADQLAAWNVTPNQVTLAALAGSVIVGAAVLLARRDVVWLLVLPAWLLLRLALNAIDGLMAREHGLATPQGAMLNELGDVLSDAALYLPLAVVHPGASWTVVAFVIGAILTEMCGVLAHGVGSRRRYDGPMGKGDRAALVSVLALVTVFVPAAVAYWSWVLAAAILLEAATCGNRVRGALRERGDALTADGLRMAPENGHKSDDGRMA